MEARLRKYLEQRIPRYTSYPSAVQFGPDVDAQTYERWLAALPDGEPVSLYIHVPFCAALCLYCGCHTSVVNDYAPVASYAELLEREITLIGDLAGRRNANHIHSYPLGRWHSDDTQSSGFPACRGGFARALHARARRRTGD